MSRRSPRGARNITFRSLLTPAALAAILCFSAHPAAAQLPQPDGGNLERGTLPTHWFSQDSKCMEIPQWQVHEYNPNFIILRQPPCTDYEKPFVFLFFGNHIEESSTPFLDYPVGTLYQPNEHELQLSRGALLELDDALISLHGMPRRLALRDFSIWPSGPSFDSPAEDDAYKSRQEQQRAEMWDHDRH